MAQASMAAKSRGDVVGSEAFYQQMCAWHAQMKQALTAETRSAEDQTDTPQTRELASDAF